MLERELRERMARFPEVEYGFTAIGYSPYAGQYASALVFAVPYGDQLTLAEYTEERFDRGIQEARARLEAILAEIEEILRKHGARYWIPPVAQENETDLLAPFSFKFAAVNAGLGWIGKNDVVVTRRYGPRVRLSAVLIDAAFEYAARIGKCLCPDDCAACVGICPCRALRDRRWDIDTLRSEMIDYHRCNRMRSAAIKKLGRKSACGLCLTVCPIGRGTSSR